MLSTNKEKIPMPEADTGVAAPAITTPAPATPTTPTAPWYEGKADAETIGYLQNKGWADDPVKAAIEASKAHRAAERHLGAPADQLIRLPKDGNDPAWNNVWNRLGKPIDPKLYDFSDIKLSDGSAIDDAFADTLRKAAFENHIPKDAAKALASAMVKHAEQSDATDALEAKAKWDQGVAKIKESWGPKFNANQLQAMEGARKLGISQELYDTMAKAAGVDVIAELFRKIGSGISEDKLVEGSGASPSTVEAATARRTELMADKEWMARYRKGGTLEKREMHNLQQIITGVIDTAA
jgi:hypothetical protein